MPRQRLDPLPTKDKSDLQLTLLSTPHDVFPGDPIGRDDLPLTLPKGDGDPPRSLFMKVPKDAQIRNSEEWRRHSILQKPRELKLVCGVPPRQDLNETSTLHSARILAERPLLSRRKIMPQITGDQMLIALRVEVEVELVVPEYTLKKAHRSPVVSIDLSRLQDSVFILELAEVGEIVRITNDILFQLGSAKSGFPPFKTEML